MRNHSPLPRSSPINKHIQRGNCGSSLATQQILVDVDPCNVSFNVDVFLGQYKLHGFGARKQGYEGTGHFSPASQRYPTWMRTGHSIGVLPNVAHGVDIALFEGLVISVVGGLHGGDCDGATLEDVRRS